jgi:hypothetical protein
LPSACAPANARSTIRFEPTICAPSADPDPTEPHDEVSGTPCSPASVLSQEFGEQVFPLAGDFSTAPSGAQDRSPGREKL